MKVSFLLAGLALFFAPMGRADSVLIGNSFVNLALAVSSGEFLAQPLVLTGTASISDIDVTFISNEPNSVFQFEVTNAGREREYPLPKLVSRRHFRSMARYDVFDAGKPDLVAGDLLHRCQHSSRCERRWLDTGRSADGGRHSAVTFCE